MNNSSYLKENYFSRAFSAAISLLAKITAERILFFFIFCQPLLDFIKNQALLNNIKHGVFRFITLTLLFYTVTYSNEMRRKHTIFNKKSFSISLLILYVLTAFASSIIAFSQSEMETGRLLVALTTLPLLVSLIYIIPFWINSIELIQKCLRAYFYSMVYVLIIGFIQLFLSVGGEGAYRIKSVFNDPNLFSRFLLIGLFFLILQLMYKNYEIISKKSTIYLIIATISQIILSFSRSGYITLFLGLLFLAFSIKKKAVKIFLITFVVAISIMAVAFLISQRFSQSSMLIEASSFNRVLLILGGLNMIQHNWLIGVGYTNFQYIFTKYYVKDTIGMSLYEFDNLGFATSIHNWLIEVFSEQGILGLIGFVGIFTSVVFRLKKLKKRIQNSAFLIIIRGFIMMIFVFLFQGFFYHSFISQFFFWILFGLLTATLNVGINSPNNENIAKQ